MADIIPAARLCDWSNVGVSGGIPNRTTISATLSPGATAAQIQTALGNANANEVVVLSAGTYNLSGTIDWQGVEDGVVLRGEVNGSGVPTTNLIFSSGNIYMRKIFDSPHTSNVALTANFTKGSNTITVASVPSWVVVGELYVVNELNDSALISETTDEGADPFETGRALGHIIKVTAKDATTITTELPSPYTYRTSQTARLTTANYDPGIGHSSRKACGLENLNLEQTYTGSGTSHMVFMENTDGCWIKNVYSNTVAGGIHVMMYGCYRNEVRHSVFHNSKLFGGGQGYGVAGYEGGAAHLVIDNEFYDLHVPTQMNYAVAQSVIAYNYIHGGIADSEQDPGMNQHGVVAFQILWEGNYSEPKFMSDDTHGSGGYLSTVFRNVIRGDTADNTYTFDRSCINLRRYNRSFNIVGNVLGTSGYHTIYQKQATVDTYSTNVDRVVYVFGYGTGGNNDNAATMDVLRGVNFDVVDGEVLGGFTLADLEDSYWLASKPSFFGSLDWPPYGPDIGTDSTATAYTRIPAGYRAANGGVDPPASGGSVTVTNWNVGTLTIG